MHTHIARSGTSGQVRCIECNELFIKGQDSTWKPDNSVTLTYSSLKQALHDSYHAGFTAGAETRYSLKYADLDLFHTLYENDFVWVKESDCNCNLNCRHDTIIEVHMTTINEEDQIVDYWDTEDVREYLHRL